MPIGFLLPTIIICELIFFTHLLTVVLNHNGFICVILGIMLHAALFPVLFFGGAAFEIIALVMMCSLLVYVALSFVKYSLSRIRERSDENDI